MAWPNKSARFEVHALSSPMTLMICLILCPTINRSMCNLYWNKNIITFLINGAFITKLNIVLLLGHPVGLSVDKWMCPVKLNNFAYWPYRQAVRSATHLSAYKWRILFTNLCVQSTLEYNFISIFYCFSYVSSIAKCAINIVRNALHAYVLQWLILYL